MVPKLSNVIRLDSLPLGQTFFTPEGYLRDRPILTSTGIFEYHNPDGSVRRELRLPEDVFDPESLASYRGKPVIITHDAGLVTKDNVDQFIIGTILSDGYRSGDDVRADIIIHNTDDMKDSGLKELSLGYNLDLDETPGEWNGEPYDAIQRNIRINHLALVREARAGEQARLNIDSRDPETTLRGGKVMSKTTTPKAPAKAHRSDGILTQEAFAKAVEEYKARRAQRIAAKADSEAKPTEEPAIIDEPAVVVEDSEAVVAPEEPATPEATVQMVKDRRDLRDNAGDPEDIDSAKGIIAQQDEDLESLFDLIDTLLAKGDYDKAPEQVDGVGEEPAAPAEEPVVDSEEPVVEEEPVVGAAVDGEDEENCDGEGCENKDCDENVDSDDADVPVTEKSEVGKTVTNIDSADKIDAIVRQRVKLGMMGRQLNLDGLEDMSIMDAKKAIILAVRPGMRLDGKSSAYISAAYDCAIADVAARNEKGTEYQKRQMFNKDSKPAEDEVQDSSVNARQRMIERQQNKNKEEK